MTRIILDVVAVGGLVGPMLLSAGGVALVIRLFATPDRWPWYAWLLASPVLYLGWCLGFLVILAVTSRYVGLRHPKPRHAVIPAGSWSRSSQFRGVMTAVICYRRLRILQSVPFWTVLSQFRYVDRLVLRTYSPSVHIGPRVMNMGMLYDPDLTHVGEDAVIGGQSSIVAHAMSRRADGALVYVSAPVTIGPRATIGGEARVTLGCVVGADAILELGAVLEPFTTVPSGEVWGGNPARPRRAGRQDVAGEAVVPAPAVHLAPAPVTSANEMGAGVSPTRDQLRRLVVEALTIDPDEASGELSAETCAAWDSLGQVAIAAAVFDKYGVAIDPGELFTLKTLDDVARVVATSRAPAAEGGADPLNAVTEALPRDVEMLPLLETAVATRMLAEASMTSPTGTPLRVLITASFTAEPIAPTLKVWAAAFGMDVECHFAGYDQVVQTLLAPADADAMKSPALTVVLLRPEDLAADWNAAAEQVDEILGAIAHAANRGAHGRLIVGSLPPVVSAFSTRPRRETDRLRERFQVGLDALTDIEVLDVAEVVERIGVHQARSSQSEVLTRGPYSPRLYQELAVALVRRLRAARRSSAKVIALDCDNTLWGGVVGEVGLDGIDLGADGIGRSYQLFQRRLQQLRERGVLLVIVSRNEDRDVRDVFARHPGMVLRADDIAAWRVNWAPKSVNLRELADELNIALDAFVLFDDDAAVRMEVEVRQPDVHVVPLPADPSRYCETLDRLWLFDGRVPTLEDGARTRMMHDEQRRRDDRLSAPTLDAFLQRLELKVVVRRAGDADVPRVAQLTQRTNQFNLSLKRRTVEDIERLRTECDVLVVHAADRFGDYGLVGVCALARPTPEGVVAIDTLLMSCRALGRGVEDAFLHAVASVAAGAGGVSMRAPLVAGPRNAQVATFLARQGFEEATPAVWIRSLTDRPALPAHVQLRLDLSASLVDAD